MKQDPGWDALLLAADPLKLLDLIEMNVRLTNTDNYAFAVAYKQHKDFCTFQQNNLNNNQFYDKFKTRITVAKAIGIAWSDPICLNWVINNVEPFKTNHAGTDYEDLDKADRALVRDKTEERYLGYVMTMQSAAVNDKLKTDMHNNFTVGTNIYPASMQKSLHLLDKYSKQIAVQPVQPKAIHLRKEDVDQAAAEAEAEAEAEVMQEGFRRARGSSQMGRFNLLSLSWQRSCRQSLHSAGAQECASQGIQE